MTLIISNNDVENLLSMTECMDVLEEAYIELADGRGVSRTRSEILTPTRREDSQYSLKSVDGVIPKFEVGAVRITSDILTWPKDGNMRRVVVPSAPGNRYVGLVLLFSTANGEPLAIFQDGIMQRTRVGAANGLGVKYLARKDAKSVGLLGSGWQASGQLLAACAVRDIQKIRCFSPNRNRRETFAKQMTKTLGIEVVPVDDAESAFTGVDIAMCATNTIDYIFFERWIRPGLHITSIKEEEIEPAAVRRADRVVVHTNSEPPINVYSKGLHTPHKTEAREVKDKLDLRKLPTLWSMLAGQTGKRQSEDEVTCLVNAQGTGYQFAAAGWLVYKKAKAMGIGHELPTEWFTEDVPN
jgi:ornithine cyclodeaminase/alanine dehydrogenase-like protein (mu-crystallin family)